MRDRLEVVVVDRKENLISFEDDYKLYFKTHPIHVQEPMDFQNKLRQIRDTIGRLPDCVLMDINWYSSKTNRQVLEKVKTDMKDN